MLEKEFQEILDVGISLSSEHDLETLLNLILTKAQELTKADGGSIYLVNKNKMIFKTSRNNTLLKKLGPEKIKEIVKTFEMPVTKQSLSGYAAVTGKPLNIPDVNKITKESDFHYDPSFDIKYGYNAVSMLVVPLINKENKVLGVLQLVNSLRDGMPVAFEPALEKIIFSFSSQAAVAIENTQLADQLKDAHYETIFRLSEAAEYRDKETANHIIRVSHYSRLLAEKLGFDKEYCEMIFWSSPMHDIGKLGIPDSILQKPGPLTPEERSFMERHTVIGALVLKDSEVPVISRSRIVALTHHEKYDGTGYPQKLKGADIPLEGRIVALADVFDAISSKRVYREPMPEEKVLSIIKEGAGRHFDPELVAVFISCLDKVNEIKLKYADLDAEVDKFARLEGLDLKALL